MRRVLVVSLVLLGLAGSVSVAQQAAPKPGAPPPRGAAAAQQSAVPAFDGDVAALAWGGRLESLSGAKDLNHAQGILAGDWSHAVEGKGPVEALVSFFERETVLVRAVRLESLPHDLGMRDVEIWTTNAAAPEGFTKVSAATVAREPNAFKHAEVTLTFEPVEARFVQVRFLNNHRDPKVAGNPYAFRIARIQVFEGQAPGYVPLLTRHPEIAEPVFMAEGAKAAAAQRAPVAGCSPDADPDIDPGDGESRNVLLLMTNYLGGPSSFVPLGIESGRFPKTYPSKWKELDIFGRIKTRLVALNHVQPWMLAGVDTVVMQQACNLKPLSPRFRKALTAWVAAGHKLIIHDSDKCGSTPDYSWLPYRFKSDNPGAFGKPGSVLRIVENNWMAHTYRTRPGFVDTAEWVSWPPPGNELGDSNAIMEWDPGWCGHMVVKNADGIFGVVQAYAHHGRGLIIWDGLDVDMVGTRWMDVIHARQLSQGFNTDNLPCSIRVGNFIVTTEPRLGWRGVQPGKTYEYPLSLVSNLGYKGVVSLTASATPAIPGLKTAFEPASLEVSSLQESKLSLTMPAGGEVKPFALEVKGAAADGKTNSLCLQVGPLKSGELAVVSQLAPPTKTRRNLEIILDASGSMKAVMAGKKTRWDVALETLDQVLNTLPDDFNVGLRMYGHREASTSPKTCTDTQLLVPVRKLNRAAIMKSASAFKPKGETPLVYSSLQAPGDLKQLGGGTVILITDGEESCKGDPVKAAEELKASGLDIRLNIVGFALKNPKTQQELAAFAQATGGLYYAANTGAALADAVTVAAIEKFPYTVYDMAGKVVLASEAGSGSDPLPPGTYKVAVKAGARELVAPKVSVALGQSVTLTIAMKNGQLTLQ
ncbi:MAG TPA: hypothetical protein PKK95_09650 [Vicinamibacterales bacterium]|jgi:hypothetical protein|nr:hypothetical protein [Acidobacteriota bacterium]HOC18522.1 hypothetical protein [Vicinamibacterales bacterium]